MRLVGCSCEVNREHLEEAGYRDKQTAEVSKHLKKSPILNFEILLRNVRSNENFCSTELVTLELLGTHVTFIVMKITLPKIVKPVNTAPPHIIIVVLAVTGQEVEI